MDAIINGLGQRLSELSLYFPQVTAGHVATGISAALAAALLAQFEMRWWPRIKNRVGAWIFAIKDAKRKKMRTKEAMDNREVRLREILGEVIVDGLLTRGANGELSIQEEKRLLIQASQKLGIPDLVSQKMRVDIIKQEIWARFHLGYYAKSADDIKSILAKRKKARETPPPLPKEARVVTTVANKYWHPKPVAA